MAQGGKKDNERKRGKEIKIRVLSKYASTPNSKKKKNPRCTTDVYECSRRTARLVIPRERTPLRSFSTRSRSSSLHTSRESPVLPEGTPAHTHKEVIRDYFKLCKAFGQCFHVCTTRPSLHSYTYS